MANGDLQTHLATTRPSGKLQLQWFIEMARALDYIHERCVLVADIAIRNFFLDARLSLKICDFSEASLIPLGSDMLAADDNGYTTQIDIGLLGAVMYEIATGVPCKVDLYRDNDQDDGRACKLCRLCNSLRQAPLLGYVTPSFNDRRWLSSERSAWLFIYSWLVNGALEKNFVRLPDYAQGSLHSARDEVLRLRDSKQ